MENKKCGKKHRYRSGDKYYCKEHGKIIFGEADIFYFWQVFGDEIHSCDYEEDKSDFGFINKFDEKTGKSLRKTAL
jgi:hypothetical protein